MNNKSKRDIFFLLALIVACAILARSFAGHETLEEYAKSHSSQASTGSSSAQASTEASSAKESSSESTDHSSAKDSSTESTSIENSATASSTDEVNSSVTNSSYIPYDNDVSDTRVTYSEGFYYEALPDSIITKITNVSYPKDCEISLDDLRYCVMLYVDFEGETKTGEMICNKSIADDVMEIFHELYENDYRIESIKLIDDFDADDEASMEANNTSCFNYRPISSGKKLSKHATGIAIDLNPLYNPQVKYKNGSTVILPSGSEEYADRTADFPYKIDQNDLAYKLFTSHGFSWGGNWNSSKDYQHFEKKNG
ncbi:M15 family peptidase [Butyrivibrio sp. X503]|uniref:M15 family metallopeptidase n=1 Tax=Butyrivibrio sp. X503 TaxID=2364878 RepID=UPI000EAA2731|nr:M15 family metallopeptidase [Butyrivibrio sp. X503]RKM56577.1 M15 family peptidase [Butyrivibrio sp. X503]